MDMHWFNVSAKPQTIKGHTIRLWNFFKRRSTAGHWWGVGLLQIGTRSLFFVGRVQDYPEREVWSLDLFFCRVI